MQNDTSLNTHSPPAGKTVSQVVSRAAGISAYLLIILSPLQFLCSIQLKENIYIKKEKIYIYSTKVNIILLVCIHIYIPNLNFLSIHVFVNMIEKTKWEPHEVLEEEVGISCYQVQCSSHYATSWITDLNFPDACSNTL